MVLNHFLHKHNIAFDVIEIAGAGSPYWFATGEADYQTFWHCLFKDKKIEELPAGSAGKAVRRKLDVLMPDIVFAGAIAFPSGAACVRWANENRKKCVVFDDARLKDVPRRWYVNFIKRRVYSGVDAIFCPAPAWNETFRYFGFLDDQIFHGLNVVDNNFWEIKQAKYSKPKTRENYFLTIGRYVAKKNFIVLLKAYRRYVNRATNPRHLVIVGDGPDNDSLKSATLAMDLQNLVHFHPFLSQTELRSFYQNASWFILPSRYGETWGLVVNEAMASGLPVIVSDQVGCASTLVKDCVNGYTFSPENEEELATILLKAATIPEEDRENMGLKSQEIISDWNLDRFCTGVNEALHFVTDRDKRNPDLLGRLVMKVWKGRYRPV